MKQIRSVKYISPVLLMLSTFLFSTTVLASASGGGGGTSPYYSIKPPFVVNVNDGDRVRHMQITTQLHAKDMSLLSQLDIHKPAIQHALIVLFSGQEVSEIKTVAGKQKLRKEALQTVQKIMKKNVGAPVVDAIYFTDFIIQ